MELRIGIPNPRDVGLGIERRCDWMTMGIRNNNTRLFGDQLGAQIVGMTKVASSFAARVNNWRDQGT
jgi:hypothetical protein